jgi:hypothetical protein
MGHSQSKTGEKFTGLPVSEPLMQQLAQRFSGITFAAYVSGRRFEEGEPEPNPRILNEIFIRVTNNNPATTFSDIMRRIRQKFVFPNVAWYLENTPSNLSALCRHVSAPAGTQLTSTFSSNGVREITVGAVVNPGPYEGNVITASSSSAISFVCPL